MLERLKKVESKNSIHNQISFSFWDHCDCSWVPGWFFLRCEGFWTKFYLSWFWKRTKAYLEPNRQSFILHPTHVRVSDLLKSVRFRCTFNLFTHQGRDFHFNHCWFRARHCGAWSARTPWTCLASAIESFQLWLLISLLLKALFIRLILCIMVSSNHTTSFSLRILMGFQKSSRLWRER